MSADIDAYRLVGDPAALERAGLFVAEGRLIVGRLLLDGRFRVHSVAVTPPAAAALANVLRQRPDVRVDVVDPAALQAVTGFDFHRGCLALAHRPAAPMQPAEPLNATRLLALERVANPDNVGGLFRTAFAFGVDAVILDPSTADPLYRKAIRTSMAATLRVPFFRAASWPGSLDPLRAAGFQIVALTPHAEAVDLDEYARHAAERLVLLVGSEGSGLDETSMRVADVRVRIAVDPRSDSLNVVVAAGIALNRLLIR